MSWEPGWYGFDPESELHEAWGPELTADEARSHPSSFPDDGAEERILVFFISVSESERRHSWERKRIAAHWTDGPDSEAGRAFRGEGTRRELRELCELCGGFGDLCTPDGYDCGVCDRCCGSGIASADVAVADPAHTPAARRAVAWEQAGAVWSTLEEAYRAAALAMMRSEGEAAYRLLNRPETEDLAWESHWDKVRDRLAARLRHRDEKAGWR